MLIKLALIAHLHSRGWKMVYRHSAAEKVYDTYVGDKLATIYIDQVGASLTLSADYFAGGRNILSEFSTIVPENSCPAHIAQALDDFIDRVEGVVKSSDAYLMLHQLPLAA